MVGNIDEAVEKAKEMQEGGINHGRTHDLQIITPDEIAYTGEASFLVGKIDGEFGILPNHAPMIVALDIAPLRLDAPDGQKHYLAVFGGFCEIEHNQVSIVTMIANCQILLM